MNPIALVRPRIGLGAVIVVLGAAGTFAAARLVQEDSEDARHSQSGPLVASADPVFPPVSDRDDLLARLNAADFWESLASDGSGVVDGEDWIVEGRRNGT